jgi:hypothetical protein
MLLTGDTGPNSDRSDGLYIYVYIYIYIYIYIYTHTRAYMHVCMHAYMLLTGDTGSNSDRSDGLGTVSCKKKKYDQNVSKYNQNMS